MRRFPHPTASSAQGRLVAAPTSPQPEREESAAGIATAPEREPGYDTISDAPDRWPPWEESTGVGRPTEPPRPDRTLLVWRAKWWILAVALIAGVATYAIVPVQLPGPWRWGSSSASW
jgi:hypothetical protein